MERKRNAWLFVIGIGKLLKCALLGTVGVLTLVFARHEDAATLHAWSQRLNLAPGHKLLHRVLAAASGMGEHRLELLGIGALIYATLFAIEGVGLVLQKRWGEYVTVGITGSLLPFEVYELAEHASAAKALTFALNLAAVVYLIVNLRKTRANAHTMPA